MDINKLVSKVDGLNSVSTAKKWITLIKEISGHEFKKVQARNNRQFISFYNFTNDDVVDIWKEAFAHQADAICITEKDAVKLSQLHAIEDLKIPILVLSIGIEFISGKQEFIENLEI